ncbi:MAG TPA: STAS domain-containing protein [Acidimicrobiales bacterium]|nr:STAS domain-containing protein [Acidimicrobiales bacterium]
MSRKAATAGTSLRIELSLEGERCVCRVSGDLDAGSAARLRAVLAERLDEGRDAVIDLAGLAFIDSSGIGVLVGALKRFEAAGARLALRAPTASLRRVLDMTGLAGAFPVDDD